MNYCLRLEAVVEASFGLSPYISPLSTDQGLNVRVLPDAKYVYYNYVLQNWGNNYRVGLGTHCESDLG
jgi:hypothetical protein